MGFDDDPLRDAQPARYRVVFNALQPEALSRHRNLLSCRLTAMRLNGWQRLSVVLALTWTIVVGVMTWNTWPATYLSADPNAGLPPVGADVTLLADGLLRKGEILNRGQFAARLKAKYPEYSDLTDEELVTRMLKKFPYYSSYIKPPDLDENLRPEPYGFVPDPPETVSALNRVNRNKAIRSALMLWLLPPAALYAIGFSVRWVYRGFKTH
jgi:hypothetical protein